MECGDETAEAPQCCCFCLFSCAEIPNFAESEIKGMNRIEPFQYISELKDHGAQEELRAG